ncbi:hypothetical protein MJD09_20915 [bacterium]|nr:hypothetical protein [bacterium]
MTDEDILTIISPIINCFLELHIPYYIGGSIASSAYGFPRTTADVDLAAEITYKHVPQIVRWLEKDYFIQQSTVREAIDHERSFNIIHFGTAFKIDVFVLTKRRFDREVISRKRKELLDEKRKLSFYLSSPEDTVLFKIEWYKKGGEVSERQWTDLLGVLKVQKHQLDKDYLLKWAGELKISDLLRRAFDDSGFEEDD